MKPPFTSALLVFLLGVASSAAATDKPAAPATAADAAASSAVPGKYAGTWKGPEDSGGTLRIALKQESGGQWTAEASFTFENTQVPTKTKSVQVDGTKLLLIFTWAVDGSSGESHLTGELAGDKLSGTYKTITETPSSGTWTVTRGG